MEKSSIKKNKKKLRFSVYGLIFGILLTLYSLFLISLFIYAFVNSFKDLLGFINDPVGLPEKWHWKNYITIIENFKKKKSSTSPTYFIGDMFAFSFLYAMGCSLASIIATTLMAYACAMFPNKFSKIIYAVVIFTIIFPIIGSLPSELNIAKQLHFYDTFLGNYFLKFSFTNIYFLLLYENFKAIPKDFSEAATVDGASMFYVMIKIMLPLAINTIGTILLIQFVAFWNNYETPLVFMPSYPTISIGLMSFFFNTSGPVAAEPFKMGACLVVLIPILIVFIVFQKKLMGNVSAGGIKG